MSEQSRIIDFDRTLCRIASSGSAHASIVRETPNVWLNTSGNWLRLSSGSGHLTSRHSPRGDVSM